MKKNKLKSGFTLIEILIASYIFVVVMVAATVIFSSSVGAKMKAQVYWENQQEARFAMEKITRATKDSTIKSFAVESGPKLILCSDYYSSCSSASASGGKAFQFWYDINAKAIYMQKGGSTAIRLTSSNVEVSNVSFSPSNPATTPQNDENKTVQRFVTVSFTVKNAPGIKRVSSDTLTLKTTMALRYYYKYKY
ncbi:MAG TPA: prepilin-type N-terminal cleavage/methylation domain-containing protein [Patescibacteria group bacterium]|nr:prepilin-type N-terminal cleavage/methylation domain-containing protein [Patescibacteria group bacterium]